MTHIPRVATALPLVLLAGCIEQSFVVRDGDDTFYQLEAGKVDVLLAVDNSCSMAPYQEELASNFDEFLTFFIEGNVEYQIGVVTTSVAEAEPVAQNGCTQADVNAIPSAGELVGGTWITPETPNAADAFGQAVRVGICGSGYEMGIESAYRAVTEPLASQVNAGFIRDDAYLSIIFVSDEQDASPLPVNQYINAFEQVKGQRNRDIFNASALVVADPADCGANSGLGGTRYLDVAAQMGVIGTSAPTTSRASSRSCPGELAEDTSYLRRPDASTSSWASTARRSPATVAADRRARRGHGSLGAIARPRRCPRPNPRSRPP